MPLYKRRIQIPTGQFVTTGQTGQFFPTSETGKFVPTGFTNLGVNGEKYSDTEFVFSNSNYPKGNAQYSILMRSTGTEGIDFGNDSVDSVACFKIVLPKTYLNQSWLIKSEVLGIGQHCNGTKNQTFTADYSAIVTASDNSYNLTGPFYTIYTKSQPTYSGTFDIWQSGVAVKLFDSNNTKTQWTAKIGIIQSIQDEDLNLLNSIESINAYIANNSSSNSVISSASDLQIYNLDEQIPIVDAGEDSGILSDNAMDGGDDDQILLNLIESIKVYIQNNSNIDSPSDSEISDPNLETFNLDGGDDSNVLIDNNLDGGLD
jgi:hypothetical protein